VRGKLGIVLVGSRADVDEADTLQTKWSRDFIAFGVRPVDMTQQPDEI
jgi:hypothetical protein